MIHVKQSTAVTLKFGPFLDSTDGVTAETALTINQADVRLSKNGGNIAQKNDAGAATHDELGYYDVDLDTTDTNTLGVLRIAVSPSGALPVWQDVMVMPANVYDSLYGADNLQIDLIQVNGDAQSLSDLKDFADAGYDPITNKVQGVVLVDTTTTNSDMRGTDGANTTAPATPTDVTDAQTAIIAEVDANEAKIDTIDGVVDSVLARIGAFTGSGVNTILGFLQALMRSDASNPSDLGGTYDATNHSNEAIRDRGDIGWVTGGATGITQIINPRFIIPAGIDLADTVSVRFGIMVTNTVDDLPSTAEITPGTISIERKAFGGTSWTAVVTDAACSEQNGFIYYDEVFDSGSGYAAGDSLRITFKSQSVVADSNTHEITDSSGVFLQTYIREQERGTDGANTTTPATPTDVTNAQTAIVTEVNANETKIDIIDGIVDSIQSDTDDIQTRLPAALVGGRMDSNASAINNDNQAAINLSQSAGSIQGGAAVAGTLSTTQMSTDLPVRENDAWNGRTLIFINGGSTPATLVGQATDITDYDELSKTLTFTAVTTAPVAGTSFIIV